VGHGLRAIRDTFIPRRLLSMSYPVRGSGRRTENLLWHCVPEIACSFRRAQFILIGTLVNRSLSALLSSLWPKKIRVGQFASLKILGISE
jgi:hypothetical protein